MAVNHLGIPRMRRVAGAAACALAAAGLAGAALAGAPPVSAATPSCGQSCVDLFNAVPGASLLLDSKREGNHTGNPIVLFRVSNTNPAEDFTVDNQGLVSDFYAAGLVSAAVNQHYGGGAAGSPDDFAFELEYDPFGAPASECVGTAGTAAEGAGVSLQPCGVSAATIWIVDSSASINGSFVPLINGTDTNFSTPYVLTYPMSSDVQLETATLQSSAGQAPNNQLWSEYIGLANVAATATAVASSPDPSAAGAPVTYTATVSPAPDGGTVTFTDNGTPVTGCSAVPVSGATAACTTIPGSAGAHNIVATYSGTASFPTSRSAVVTQVVTSTQCASLADCNLSGLNLAGAQLAGASLSAANLNGATLTGADLAGANLSGANFNKANLTGADLTGATVTGTTNFNHVTWSDTTCPDGTNSDNDGGTCTGHL